MTYELVLFLEVVQASHHPELDTQPPVEGFEIRHCNRDLASYPYQASEGAKSGDRIRDVLQDEAENGEIEGLTGFELLHCPAMGNDSPSVLRRHFQNPVQIELRRIENVQLLERLEEQTGHHTGGNPNFDHPLGTAPVAFNQSGGLPNQQHVLPVQVGIVTAADIVPVDRACLCEVDLFHWWVRTARISSGGAGLVLSTLYRLI